MGTSQVFLGYTYCVCASVPYGAIQAEKRLSCEDQIKWHLGTCPFKITENTAKRNYTFKIILSSCRERNWSKHSLGTMQIIHLAMKFQGQGPKHKEWLGWDPVLAEVPLELHTSSGSGPAHISTVSLPLSNSFMRQSAPSLHFKGIINMGDWLDCIYMFGKRIYIHN